MSKIKDFISDRPVVSFFIMFVVGILLLLVTFPVPLPWSNDSEDEVPIEEQADSNEDVPSEEEEAVTDSEGTDSSDEIINEDNDYSDEVQSTVDESEEEADNEQSNEFLIRDGYIVVDENNVYNVMDEQEEEVIEQIVIDEDEIEAYREIFIENEEEFNSILTSYNNSINQLFTGSIEQETFFVELNSLINVSNGLIIEMESMIAPSGFQEFHNYYIAYINNVHGLLLNASDLVEESIAERQRVDRRELRENYLEVKRNQTQMIRYAMHPVDVTQDDVDSYGRN